MGARYRAVYKEGKLLAEYEGGELTYLSPEYSAPNRSDVIAAPMIMKDIGEYRSPLDGQIITSRSQHRDHIREHDVVEVGNEPLGKMKAATDAANVGPKVDREFAQAVKRRLDEVSVMPQKEYDAHVATKRAEHSAVAALPTTSSEVI